jgi:DNA-binding IclR family transcriptional regulator
MTFVTGSQQKVLNHLSKEPMCTVDIVHMSEVKTTACRKRLAELVELGMVERIWDSHIGKEYWRLK